MPPRRRAPVSTDKRFRKKNPASLLSDFGPKERWQHSGRVLEPTERVGVVAARATECQIIDILVMRRMLDAQQNKAALRFKLDYHRAGLSPHVTGSYTPAIAKTDPFTRRERNDVEEAAYQRYRLATKILGQRFSGLVVSCFCHDMAPAPVDIPRLRVALELLVDWYGIGDSR